jgi:hypothetical protein
MKSQRRMLLNRLSFLLNGLAFLMNGITLVTDLRLLFGIVHILAGVSNISLLIIKVEKIKHKFYIMIYIFNIIVALLTSYDFFISGKTYIQYVWILIALMSLVTLILHLIKGRAKVI